MKMFKRIALGIFVILSSMTLQAEEPLSDIEPFSQAELEQILAPIALYPDTVLSHILIAATYPLEIVQAERWTLKNPDIEGSDAVQAVENEEWDPSVKALAAFPQVLKRLSENLEWTQKLGDAFLQDEEKLLASVQSLRQRAYEAGNLDKMDKVSVTHEDDSIVIEPVEREVVYVPYYDTRVVYGPWHWSHYPPVYWNTPYYARHNYGHHVTPFYWGPSVHVSFGFFFSSFHWHNHHVVRIPYHHYQPHHYYDRHQIASHQHARRWTHNPTHRRGVSYRSVTVSNRYKSNRPSQAEVKNHRKTRQHSTKEGSSDRKADRKRNDRIRESNIKKVDRTDKRNTRIATPDRIKKELSDGRISVKERKNRPTTRDSNQTTTKSRNNREKSRSTSKNKPVTRPSKKEPETKNDSSKNNRSSGRNEQNSRTHAPARQEYQPQPAKRENRSSSSDRSSSRNSSSSSNNRSSNSSRSERSRDKGDRRR